MNVVVNGLMTNYRKAGKGKALVFLHGWGDTSTTFYGLVEDLKSNYEVFALDLPGFGGSQAPESAWSLSDYTDFIDAWLKKVGLTKVYCFIGHSYGGAVGIQGLGSGKIASQKLVLLASAGVRNKNGFTKTVMKAGAKAAKVPLKFLPAHQQQKIRQKFYSAAGSDLLLQPHMEETFRIIISEDVQDKARLIKIPTLLVYGTQDRKTPVSDGKLLNQAIAGSTLKVLDGAGHFLHQDKAEEVNHIITAFLKGKA